MKTQRFKNEPFSDWELFEIFKESSSGFDEKSTWALVQEAKEAYHDVQRTLVHLEMAQEANERNNDSLYHSYAA